MNVHEKISKVARELYEKSGWREGRDLENWLEAEKIVMNGGGRKKGGEESGSGKEKRAAVKRGARKTEAKGETKSRAKSGKTAAAGAKKTTRTTRTKKTE
ncbi:MAG: DUF2934 domain-containing protein [Nitrospirales bacterium]|nr:DUF2934 domain-containing protein [Nitrospirales bacterium]